MLENTLTEVGWNVTVVTTRAYVVLLTLEVSYITSVFTLAYETNNLRRLYTVSLDSMIGLRWL